MDHYHICAHNHHHRAVDILAEAEAHCRDHGLRLTEQRRVVLEILANSAIPLGAYELLERIAISVSVSQKSSQKRLAPIAIYRALDFLLEAGLIHRLESRNAFIVCPHRHGLGETIVFMICETCGQVEEAMSDEIHSGLRELAARRHFQLKAQVIELAGHCMGCSAIIEN